MVKMDALIDKFTKITLFWKFYFFLFLLINILGYRVLFYELEILHLIDLIVSLPSLVALFALGFKKKLFVKFYWKSYFYFFVVWYFIFSYWLFPTSLNLFEQLQTTLVIGIAYFALYIYVFKILKKWKRKIKDIKWLPHSKLGGKGWNMAFNIADIVYYVALSLFSTMISYYMVKFVEEHFPKYISKINQKI